MQPDRADDRVQRGGVPSPGDLPVAVVLYTTKWCGYCHLALRMLKKRGIAFEEIGVDGNGDAREWLRSTTGRTTVPQIFVHGRSIGGYTDLAALDESGELERLLANPSE
jgi:glutaredoxin 3